MMDDITSVSGRTWRQRPHDSRDAIAIAQRLGLPELMGRILASRNIALERAQAFLQPTLREFLPDPFHLKDMEKAARRIAEEIVGFITEGTLPPSELRSASLAGLSHRTPPRIHATTSSIAIFGDYDVDGATSSALLTRYFHAFGIKPLVHIPDRIKEGYGPNTPALISLHEHGVKLVITVDCGTTAFEPLAAAKEAGMEVIVVDHHKGDAQLPECYALVNPNRYDETSEHTQLAACGVTFLLLVAVNKILKQMNVGTPDLLQLLDLVALGTVCDVVPLTGVNRALVAQGLKIMSTRRNPGITAAMDVARLTEPPGTYHVGFIVGPRINAGGRVGKPDLGVRLLSTDDMLEARAIAAELDGFNNERKAIESLVQEEAMSDALALPASDAILIVAREGWHPGVIGIVAGRLKEHFNRPVAVVAISEGFGKASARSIPGLDLGAEVIAAKHIGILIAGGGHTMAAGFTVTKENIPKLREFFNARTAEKVNLLTRERILHIDGTVSTHGITTDLVRLIEKAGPFGAGNSSVRLLLSNIRVVRADIIGDGHVRAIVIDAGIGASSHSLKAMAFRSADTPLGQTLLAARGRNLHITGQAKINTWQGRESVDFLIDDVAY